MVYSVLFSVYFVLYYIAGENYVTALIRSEDCHSAAAGDARPSSLRFRSAGADGIIGLSLGAYGLQARQKARGFRLLQIDLRQQDEDIPFIDRLPVIHGRKFWLDAVLSSPGCWHPQSFPQASEQALDFMKSRRLQGKASPCFSILSAFSSPGVCSAGAPALRTQTRRAESPRVPLRSLQCRAWMLRADASLRQRLREAGPTCRGSALPARARGRRYATS